MRRVPVFVLAVLVLAACGKSASPGAQGTPTPSAAATEEPSAEPTLAQCGPEPTTLAKAPKLPTGFPSPGELSYSRSQKAGPSTIVTGFWNAPLDEVFREYEDSFDGSPFQITHDEQEEQDAEINFSGQGQTGQIKLEEECEGRVTVTITMRPS